MPSAKQRFQNIKGAIKEHRAMVDSEALERSVDFARLHYVDQLCRLTPSDLNVSSRIECSAACFHRILGMYEFLEVFRNLSEKPGKPEPTEPQNLDHTR